MQSPSKTLSTMETEPDEIDHQLLALAQEESPAIRFKRHPNFPLKKLKQLIKCSSSIKPLLEQIKEGLQLLGEEIALLDRLQYKNQNRFRNDRGHKALKILLNSLERLTTRLGDLAISRLLSIMPVGIPPSQLAAGTGEEVCSALLPTLDLAHFSGLDIFISLALCDRVIYCCRTAGIYALQRIALGHFWNFGANQLAIISRLWAIVLGIRHQVEPLLGMTKTIIDKLPGEGLYSEEVLNKIFASVAKSNIEISSDEITLKEPGRLKKIESNSASSSFLQSLPEDIGVKIKRSEVLQKVLSASADNSKMLDMHKKKLPSKSDTEATQPSQKKKLKRDIVTVENVPSKTKSPEEQKLKPKKDKKAKKDISTEAPDLTFIKDFHSLDDLKAWIDQETAARKSCRKLTATRKLGQDEWKVLRRKLVADFNIKLPNKSIKAARKLIRETLEQS